MKEKVLFDLKMYRRLAGMSLLSVMEYRADFLVGLLSVMLLNFANIAQIGILSWKYDSIASWSSGEMMILYGLYLVCWSIYSVFFSHISELETEIVDGTFDRYLCRPVSVFMQVVGSGVKYVGFCDTVLGVVLITAGKILCGAVWTVQSFALLLLFVLCGGTIIVCIRLLLASVSFWMTKSSPLFSLLTQLTMITEKYPAAIFGNVFKTVVTVLIPIAYMNYYPAVFLLNKADEPGWLCLLSPFFALLLAVLAGFVWKKGIRRYGSAGG